MSGIYFSQKSPLVLPQAKVLMLRRLHLSYAFLFFSASAAGQNQPCEIEVPVNIVMPNLGLARNVSPDGFVARHGSDVLDIRSITEDTASRRIVLVVENGRNINPAARKVEASVLRALVTNARAEDSFAFLTAHGPRKELPFGTPRDVLLSSIEELSSPAKGKDQGKSAFDAVLDAAGWLQPSEPGDSVIFLTMGPEESAGTELGRVGKTLTAAGIRLFGFQLGRLYLGNYSVGIAPNVHGGVVPTASIVPNAETMFTLADKTGGFFLGENTEGGPQKSYQLTDGRLQQLNKLAGQLYKGIVDYYRVRIVAAPDGFALDLTDSLRQGLPNAHLVYPRKVPGCSPTSTANPSPPSPSIR
jgi:hypothetical protein